MSEILKVWLIRDEYGETIYAEIENDEWGRPENAQLIWERPQPAFVAGQRIFDKEAVSLGHGTVLWADESHAAVRWDRDSEPFIYDAEGLKEWVGVVEND